MHTEVGHHTVGATINGVLMPLNTKLKTGMLSTSVPPSSRRVQVKTGSRS
ncbi:MAG: TGS domain-containing protein [Clostridium sp.]